MDTIDKTQLTTDAYVLWDLGYRPTHEDRCDLMSGSEDEAYTDEEVDYIFQVFYGIEDNQLIANKEGDEE